MIKHPVKDELGNIIFGTDTKLGRRFDIVILIFIVLSLFTVMLESVPKYRAEYTRLFINIEWVFTGIFTLEYILRIYSARKRLQYIFSFYGIIDLLAILPVFLGMLIAGSRSYLVIRVFRLLRIFRIFKINRYLRAGDMLVQALIASRAKISVFLFTILMIISIVGTIMYLIEGEANGFTSIPKSMYWSIVTLTTVGYGDITPQTTMGQFFSSILMILGYAIIAVPTGIISAELVRTNKTALQNRICPHCEYSGHEDNAVFCNKCGTKL